METIEQLRDKTLQLEKRLSFLQKKVGTLSGVQDLSQLTNEIEILQENINASIQDIQTLENSVTTNTQGMQTLETNMSTLEESVAGNSSSIAVVEANVIANTQDIQTLENSVATNTQDIQTVENSVTANMTNISALQSAVANHSTVVSSAGATHDELRSGIAANSFYINNLENRATIIDNNIESLGASIEANASSIAQQRSSISALNNTANNHQTLITTLSNNLTQIGNRTTTLEGAVADATSSLEDTQTAVSELLSTVTQMQATIDELPSGSSGGSANSDESFTGQNLLRKNYEPIITYDDLKERSIYVFSTSTTFKNFVFTCDTTGRVFINIKLTGKFEFANGDYQTRLLINDVVYYESEVLPLTVVDVGDEISVNFYPTAKVNRLRLELTSSATSGKSLKDISLRITGPNVIVYDRETNKSFHLSDNKIIITEMPAFRTCQYWEQPYNQVDLTADPTAMSLTMMNNNITSHDMKVFPTYALNASGNIVVNTSYPKSLTGMCRVGGSLFFGYTNMSFNIYGATTISGPIFESHQSNKNMWTVFALGKLHEIVLYNALSQTDAIKFMGDNVTALDFSCVYNNNFPSVNLGFCGVVYTDLYGNVFFQSEKHATSRLSICSGGGKNINAFVNADNTQINVYLNKYDSTYKIVLSKVNDVYTVSSATEIPNCLEYFEGKDGYDFKRNIGTKQWEYITPTP